jgi:hypothetical protein
VSQKTRVQIRKPRRLLEAPAPDWKRWDAVAKIEGISWSEFTRRALLQRTASIAELAHWADDPDRTEGERASMRERLPGLQLSEKPAKKNGASDAKKKRPPVRRGKGSSRS